MADSERGLLRDLWCWWSHRYSHMEHINDWTGKRELWCLKCKVRVE
jgi:hypothetical protein